VLIEVLNDEGKKFPGRNLGLHKIIIKGFRNDGKYI
jgi:hypothetical protein